MINKFIEIEEVIVSPDITEKKFACDLTACKGACCTMKSEFGAPLLAEEIEEINMVLEIVKQYIPADNATSIEKNGFWEEKYETLMTRSMNKRDCVFAFREGEIAKCGIERAFFDGKINFRKPISCHLFPIRVTEFGGTALRYERYSECEPALKKGKELDITILEFCKDSLIRLYGEEWYDSVKQKIGS